MKHWKFTILIFCFALLVVNSYYLPGVYPKVFKQTDDIGLKTLKLTSSKTQIPYDYYQLPFCRPDKINKISETLGELLIGDALHNTPYIIKMKSAIKCNFVCTKEFSIKDLTNLAKFIDNEYKIQLLLDGLPVVEAKKHKAKKIQKKKPTLKYIKGFDIGKKLEKNGNHYKLYNYLEFKVLYNKHNLKSFTIVGFEVKPKSIEFGDKCLDTRFEKVKSKLYSPLHFNTNVPKNITFAYSVEFEESDLMWTSRWAKYIKYKSSTLHWAAFFISVVPFLLLGTYIAIIFLKVLKKDILRYADNLVDIERQPDDSGWKLVHGDVFRPPKLSTVLSVFIGIGFQLCTISLLFIIISILGFTAPMNRSNAMNAFIYLFMSTSFINGYFSSLTYKMFNRKNYFRIAFYASFLVHCFFFVNFMVLEFLLSLLSSSSAISFLVLIELFAIWFFVSVPLSFYGAYMGYKRDRIECVAKINLIPRQILHKDSLRIRLAKIAIAGSIPFLAAFIEIYYLMNSIWVDRFYFMVIGLIIVVLTLIVLSCESSIILCYFQLCNEDFKWWWNSFIHGGSCGLVFFLYGIIYGFVNKQNKKPENITCQHEFS